MKTRPRIITLVGSSRFKKVFHQQGERLEKQGIVVLMMACFQHADNIQMTAEEFDLVHSTDLIRIDLADEVMVLNVKRLFCPCCETWASEAYSWPAVREGTHCGCPTPNVEKPYIGDSTRIEIEYAKAHGKPISYLEEPS